MNHSVGISDSYYRATEQELFQDYLHAMEYLSIGSNETKLAKTVEELRMKSRESEYILEGRLSEKEKEKQMEALKITSDMNSTAIADLSDRLIKLMEDVQTINQRSINSKNDLAV